MNEMAPLGKILVFAGLLLAAAGAVLMFSDKIPLIGRLPGDISIRKDNFTLHVPIVTCLVISATLSLVLWIISVITKK